MSARLVAAYAVILLVIVAWPGFLLRAIAPFAGALAGAGSPYLSDVAAQVSGSSVEFSGRITLGMTLVDGTPLPELPGNWRKNAAQTLNVLLVALPFWAALVMPWRRRFGALAITLTLAILFAGLDLAVEAQHAALHVIGTDWLPRHTMENTQANIEAFARLEDRYQTTRHVKAFLDAGGRLFLGVLSAWFGFALAGAAAGVRRDSLQGIKTAYISAK